MEIKYLVGIDFGHGETTASYIEIGETEIKCLSIKNASNPHDKKIVSAVCMDDEGNWKFANSNDDYKRKNLTIGFKGRVSEVRHDPLRYQAFQAFIELVFYTILENNNCLIYNKETGEKNFELYIACPSNWKNEAPKEYLEFVQEIIPAKWVIQESDAALFKVRDKYKGKRVLVIDYGSSTIDFTAYGGDKRIDASATNNGACAVERAFLSKIKKDDKHNKIYDWVVNWNKEHNNSHINVQQAEEFQIRKQKESYYINKEDFLSLLLYIRNIMPTPTNTTKILGKKYNNDRIFDAVYENKKVDVILVPYKKCLRNDFNSEKKRLDKAGFSPDIVFLTGGASRMPFVEEMIKEVFNNAIVEVDSNEPEYIVSHGIVLYAQAHYQGLKQINKKMDEKNYNYSSLYIECRNEAIRESVKKLSTEQVFNWYIANETNLTGLDLLNKLKEFFENITENRTFIELFTKEINDKLNNSINEIVKDVIKDVFNHDVDFTSSLNQETIKVFPLDDLTEFLMKNIRLAWRKPCFKFEKPRNKDEREYLANNCYKYICERKIRIPFNNALLPEEIKKYTFERACRIFRENQLFTTTLSIEKKENQDINHDMEKQ